MFLKGFSVDDYFRGYIASPGRHIHIARQNRPGVLAARISNLAT